MILKSTCIITSCNLLGNVWCNIPEHWVVMGDQPDSQYVIHFGNALHLSDLN